MDGLNYVSPEEVGWSSSALEDAAEFAEQIVSAAVMAAKNGEVFFSWGNISRNYNCHSIRKPMFGSIFGIHANLGNIDLNSTIRELGIDDIPPSLTEEEKEATVKELLQSKSGIYHPAAAETQYMEDTRPERGSHPHGTYYYYNNWDFNSLGTIFRQETGADIFEEFKRLIADPIGMEDFEISNCQYYYQYNKSEHPAYSFRMSARDLLRFGILYQQSGNWKGTQIIPQNWITESTTAYSSDEEAFGRGYGYLWYVIPEDSEFAQMVGYPGYYHTGIGVHLILVIPELQLTYVYRYDTDDPNWIDPGEDSQILFQMILDARL